MSQKQGLKLESLVSLSVPKSFLVSLVFVASHATICTCLYYYIFIVLTSTRCYWTNIYYVVTFISHANNLDKQFSNVIHYTTAAILCLILLLTIAYKALVTVTFLGPWKVRTNLFILYDCTNPIHKQVDAFYHLKNRCCIN